ncbi:Crp/Fnr family transcriptional regulator [Desulfuribacillus alkaliarsenatis]|uniref:Crp/Fnr family transcriptional regulator n=1 Tax=Desulfuribacillus alkaliarsenatis TaxID=766136 RepID=A0A1E5G4Q4_9FIRM|nr:Crp/Fnr family transcriptional regulator [Desulfuribacillus alkaliarsenatis]OEF98014.1 hypothetical protein BHF68_13205 [Desulfuribacillus alkaliarsenatis]
MLHQSHSANNLSKEILDKLLQICTKRTYKQKQIIFESKENPAHIYMVIKGSVRIYMSYPNGKEFTLAVIEERGVYSGHARGTGQAITETEIAFIPIKTFSLMMNEYPAFSLNVMAVLGEALNNSLDIIENLAFKDVDERLYSFILKNADERGIETSKGLEVNIQLTQEEIATMVGSTRQTISALLNDLQKNGLITIGKKKIWIHKIDVIKGYLKDN